MLLVNDPYSLSQQLISIMTDHQNAYNKIQSIKRNKLTAYINMVDGSKITGLELYVDCQKKHPLNKCESIMEKVLNEKIKILRKGKLCYGCLKHMAKDYNAKNCQQ